jgi:MFS family permease
MVSAGELYVFYMPLHGHAIGLSPSSIGIVLGTYAAAAFVARFSLPAILRNVASPRVLSTAMIIAAAGYFVLPLAPHIAPLLAISFAIGLVMGVAQPLSMMMSFERSPEGRTGEATGLRLTANNMARMVVPIVAGTLGGAFGALPVFWMNAVSLVAVSWITRR